MTKTSRNLIILSLCYLLVLISVFTSVGVVFGWFSGTTGTDNTAETGNINVGVSVMFGDTPATVGNELIEVSVTDENAANYLGKLKITVTVNNKIDLVLRVRVASLWVNEKPVGDNVVITYPRLENIHLINTESFIDNIVNDGCYYYYDNVGATHVMSQGSRVMEINTPGITDSQKNTVYESGTILYLSIKVDAVQANRYKEIWNVAALPVPTV